MSSADSRWAPRLYFGQCVTPLLLTTWTVYPDATKACSNVIGQYYSDCNIAFMSPYTVPTSRAVRYIEYTRYISEIDL